MISAHYSLSDVFDNLVISLCKFTTLLIPPEVSDKPILLLSVETSLVHCTSLPLRGYGIFGGDVRLASPNPVPTSDQNMSFSGSLFQT